MPSINSNTRGSGASTQLNRLYKKPPHRETPTSISRELGECVYFMRTSDDLIKIGHTANLAKRKGQFGGRWADLLVAIPGTLADEQSLHRKFSHHRARGREWYRPVPEIFDHINEIRHRCNIGPVEPWEIT